MGYKQDGLSLSTEWEADLSVAGQWANASTVPAFLAPLRANGWLARATQFWVDEEDDAPVPPDAELDQLASGWRDAIAEFFSGERRDATWKFRIAMSRTGVYATVAFAREFLTPELPDQLVALVNAWTNTLRATPISLGIGVVTPFGVDYERPVPHRESRWQLGALEYYLGRAWHLADAETAAVLRAVEAAPTPDGIVRTTTADLTRVRFTCDVTDPATIAAARARGERWFAPLAETRLAPGWNAHGDRLAVIVDRDELAPFTFYDTHHGIGYKAMVVDPDTGEVDEPLWSALAAIADTKEAYDGTPIKGVRLIAPTRADAIRLDGRAKADGIELVAYPEGDAFWWVESPPKTP